MLKSNSFKFNLHLRNSPYLPAMGGFVGRTGRPEKERNAKQFTAYVSEHAFDRLKHVALINRVGIHLVLEELIMAELPELIGDPERLARNWVLPSRRETEPAKAEDLPDPMKAGSKPIGLDDAQQMQAADLDNARQEVASGLKGLDNRLANKSGGAAAPPGPGLITPPELKKLMETFNVTQVAMGRVCRVTHNAVNEWFTPGREVPSRHWASIRNYFSALEKLKAGK